MRRTHLDALAPVAPAAMVALVLALAAACEPGTPTDAGATSTAGASSTPPPGPALGPVVDEAIATLELSSVLSPVPASAPAAGTAAPDEELQARVEGLLAVLSETPDARGTSRRVALEELQQLGAETVPVLERLLRDRARPDHEREAAAAALAATDLRPGAEALLAFVEASRGNEDPEPGLVAQCAWRLGETTQDWIVPRLLLCMRYEKDHESVLWIVSTLAGFGNFSGLESLAVISNVGTPDLASRALGLRLELARTAGFEDPEALEHAWRTGEELPVASVSPARELEVWKSIRALSEWQLRGVDDGRFVLSRLGPHAAEFLASALEDEDLYVRVHSAQCLERMGPRAAGAGAALVRALDDPALAPQAAAALGGIAYAPACDPLIARLAEGHPLEVRVAAARALGALDCREADTPLGALLSSPEAIDLRAAAAGCLVRSGAQSQIAPAVRLLAELLISGEVEPTVAEADLQAWLQRGGPERVADAVRVAWDAARDLDQAERLQRRAAIVRGVLD